MEDTSIDERIILKCRVGTGIVWLRIRFCCKLKAGNVCIGVLLLAFKITGFLDLSIVQILNTRKHNISETGSVSTLG
jgi:hypothetical protein